MPLSKARMRDRKRLDRNVKPTSNLTPYTTVKPNLDIEINPIVNVKPKVIPGLRMEGNKIVGVKPVSNLIEEVVKPSVPIYNPSLHRAGDLVRVQKGRRLIEMVIPEIDGDGNVVYG